MAENALSDIAGRPGRGLPPGFVMRNSDWLRNSLANSAERASINETGMDQTTGVNPWASYDANPQWFESYRQQHPGVVDLAYHPGERAMIGVDANGNYVPGSQFSATSNDDAAFVAGAAGILGVGALAGAGGAAGAGVAEGGAAGGASGAAGAAGGGAAAAGGVAGGGGAAGAAAGGGMGWEAIAQLGSTALQSYFANQAAGDQRAATGAAIDEQRRQFDLTRGDFAPYRAAGVSALGTLQTEMDRPITPEEVMSDPGYAFGLQQGQQNIDRRIAAMGGRVSGAAIKAAGRFGTDYASSGYNAAYQRRQDRLNRIAALAGIGQTATGSSAAAGQNSANAISGLISSQGDASAAGRVAQGNIWGNTINQFGALYGRNQRQAPRNGGNPYNSYYGGNPDYMNPDDTGPY